MISDDEAKRLQDRAGADPNLSSIRARPKTRRRFKQTSSLQHRLDAFADEMRQKVSCLPPGPEKDNLLKKVHMAESASSHLDDWVSSQGE